MGIRWNLNWVSFQNWIVFHGACYNCYLKKNGQVQFNNQKQSEARTNLDSYKLFSKHMQQDYGYNLTSNLLVQFSWRETWIWSSWNQLLGSAHLWYENEHWQLKSHVQSSKKSLTTSCIFPHQSFASRCRNTEKKNEWRIFELVWLCVVKVAEKYHMNYLTTSRWEVKHLLAFSSTILVSSFLNFSNFMTPAKNSCILWVHQQAMEVNTCSDQLHIILFQRKCYSTRQKRIVLLALLIFSAFYSTGMCLMTAKRRKFFHFLVLLLVCCSWWICCCFCLSSSGAYDPLDPNGNITIKWDVVSWTADGYVVRL